MAIPIAEAVRVESNPMAFAAAAAGPTAPRGEHQAQLVHAKEGGSCMNLQADGASLEQAPARQPRVFRER